MVYFRTKNPSLGKFLDGFGTKKVGILYGHLKYILWPFGILKAFW
jgi:hypothetical protein